MTIGQENKNRLVPQTHWTREGWNIFSKALDAMAEIVGRRRMNVLEQQAKTESQPTEVIAGTLVGKNESRSGQ